LGKARQMVLAHQILRIACERDNAARGIPGEAPFLGKDLITSAEVLEMLGESSVGLQDDDRLDPLTVGARDDAASPPAAERSLRSPIGLGRPRR
jgi:hypothetical protein